MNINDPDNLSPVVVYTTSAIGDSKAHIRGNGYEWRARCGRKLRKRLKADHGIEICQVCALKYKPRGKYKQTTPLRMAID